MITLRLFDTTIQVSFGFFFLIAVNTVTTHRITLLCLLFCVLHELAHLCVMRHLGVSVSSVKLYGGGIKISGEDVGLLAKCGRMAVYLSGCILNAMLGASFLTMGYADIGAINLFIAAFNLLPVSYFDGGKVAECLLGAYPRLLRVMSGISALLIFSAAILAALVSPGELSPSSLLTLLFVFLSELVG